MEREVCIITIRSLILDHAVAGAIETLAMAGAVAIAGHSAEQAVTVDWVVSKEVSANVYDAHYVVTATVSFTGSRFHSQAIHSDQRKVIVEPAQKI